uniref:Uncharacterized protein n=1 Tax=Rhizophora mucronata TaxID=61149 RepID=A0A2P2QIT3_RHIMU
MLIFHSTSQYQNNSDILEKVFSHAVSEEKVPRQVFLSLLIYVLAYLHSVFPCSDVALVLCPIPNHSICSLHQKAPVEYL